MAITGVFFIDVYIVPSWIVALRSPMETLKLTATLKYKTFSKEKEKFPSPGIEPGLSGPNCLWAGFDGPHPGFPGGRPTSFARLRFHYTSLDITLFVKIM